jgi:myo-inositol 2-dehydrogenase / D-chiro-inositol 1-dehydrogenase
MEDMKKKQTISRRNTLKKIIILSSGLFLPPGLSAKSLESKKRYLPSNSPGILAIGVRQRGLAVAYGAAKYGKMVACCDVDTATFAKFQSRMKEIKDFEPDYYTDYRSALERKDVDIVTIGTPDHWHAMMVIDALNAGKDVYVEKPLTLTIAEGLAVCEAVRKSGRVVQVGTQQRSEYDGLFLKAVAIAKEGILGKKLKATVFLPAPYEGTEEEFPVIDPPDSLNWDRWCGPVQKLAYSEERCHSSWRRWVETGHGTLTDWGAHHIDIAQWALGVSDTGPVEITGEGIFPHGKEATFAVITGQKPSSSLPNSYSTVRNFKAGLKFKNGNVIYIEGQKPAPEYSKHKYGLLLEGEKGDIWASRGPGGYCFAGSLADEINNDRTLQQKINDSVIQLYKGKTPSYMSAEVVAGDIFPTAHMKNFIDCVKDRTEPVSDVFTAHRANTSAILAHSAMLLGRSLKWNPDRQEFTGDEQANRLLKREYREPYKLKI